MLTGEWRQCYTVLERPDVVRRCLSGGNILLSLASIDDGLGDVELCCFGWQAVDLHKQSGGHVPYDI